MNLKEDQKKAVEKLKGINADNEFFWDENRRAPKFMKGTLSAPSSESPEAISRNFINDNKELWALEKDLDEKLDVSGTVTDRQGFHHVSFRQSLKGVPVFEGSIQVHINDRGEVVAYKDNRLSSADISFDPAVDEEAAMKTALADLDRGDKKIEKKAGLQLFRDNEKKLHLAWVVELFVEGELGPRTYFVDAHSGVLLYKYSQLRGAMSRLTYTADNRPVLPGDLLLQDDQTATDDVAQAAHKNIEEVYSYYDAKFGRDSYDGNGADLVSTVHFRQYQNRPYNNAFWSSWYKQMVYGDGDGTLFAPLAFALDVVGHELTHAVASNTARFVYAEQSGALDESFADFFGVMISSDDTVVDWEVGEGVYTPYRSGDALRDMADPSKYDQPDHMNDFMLLAPGELPDPDKNDDGYVHYNSGIPNKAAYLTCEGGSFHGIDVQGIGKEKTEQIYYLALSEFLRSSTESRWTFLEARRALLNACRQLYGDGGVEYSAIKSAWSAVGVGEPSSDYSVIEQTVSVNIPIPDNDPAGINSTINIAEDGLIKDITVDINITHTYIGDLRVALISPAGETVILHDRKGGSSDDIITSYNSGSLPALNTFKGDPVQGDWTLQVTDNANIDTGELVRWGLKLLIQKTQMKSVTKEVSPDLQIPDNDTNGIESIINVGESGSIAALSVSVDISHTWIGDLIVSLFDPSGEEVVLHNRTGKSRNDIVKTYSTKTDQIMLPFIGKKTKGDWKLKVVDLAKADAGSLNKWGIEISYE